MKKTEVNICDVCRKVVTKKKCEICSKDICINCEDDMAVGLANGGILFYIISCKGCSKKLERAKMKQFFDSATHSKIRKGMLDIFKNATMLESLQDEEEQRADRSWMLCKLKRDDEGGDDDVVNPWRAITMKKPNPWNTTAAYRKKESSSKFKNLLKGGFFKTKNG